MKLRSLRLIVAGASVGLALFLAALFLLQPASTGRATTLGVLNNQTQGNENTSAPDPVSNNDPLHIVITKVEAAPTKTPPPPKLDAVIDGVVKKWQGQFGSGAEFGLVVHNLDTNEKVSINGNKNFEAASIYKLFVMLTVYYDISQGKLSLDTPVTLTDAAADAEDDGGVLITGIGESLPVRDLLNAMITASNNTAGLMLLFQVKIPHLQQVASSLGFKDSDLSDSYNFQATPEDLDQFLSRMANQKLLGGPHDQAMLDLMSQQKVRDRIPALLPSGTRVANKTGDIYGINNDTGLVFLPNGQRLAITVMVRNSTNTTAARQFISEISLAAYNFFTPKK